MKRLLFSFFVICLFSIISYSQIIVQHAPKGFDSLRIDIAHGKIDSVMYESKTVGAIRKTLIYTPPGYSKEKKYPVLYLLHGIGGDEHEWLNGDRTSTRLNSSHANIS